MRENYYKNSYLALCISKRHSEGGHCSNDSNERLHCIAIDNGLILLVVFIGKSTLVNNSAREMYTSL